MSKATRKRSRRGLGIIILLVIILGTFGMLMDDDGTGRSPSPSAAQASALDEANDAYESGDYETAAELYGSIVGPRTRDGIAWYRYADAKRRAHNETDIQAYLRAWELLRTQDAEHPYFEDAKRQVMSNIRAYTVEARRDVDVQLESIRFTNTLSGGFVDLEADPGTTFVLYTVTMENNSNSAVGLMTAPVPVDVKIVFTEKGQAISDVKRKVSCLRDCVLAMHHILAVLNTWFDI